MHRLLIVSSSKQRVFSSSSSNLQRLPSVFLRRKLLKRTNKRTWDLSRCQQPAMICSQPGYPQRQTPNTISVYLPPPPPPPHFCSLKHHASRIAYLVRKVTCEPQQHNHLGTLAGCNIPCPFTGTQPFCNRMGGKQTNGFNNGF